jgi:hypothetical protein
LDEINDNQPNWLASAGRSKIGVQQHTESIALRRPFFSLNRDAEDRNTALDVHESTPGPLSHCYPRLMRFLDEFAEAHGKGLLSRAIIVRLAPKKEVGRHWDNGYYYLCRDRYHLILRSSGSEMECGGEHCTWHEGEVWWFDNNLWHSARNDHDDWRMHVIFDILPHRNIQIVEEFKQHTEYYKQLENA